jgi:hypothetical protein
MYNNPIVPKRIILLSIARRLKPCGPTSIPEMIRPTIPGILNLLSTIGESKIMNNTIAKITTGLENGKFIS